MCALHLVEILIRLFTQTFLRCSWYEKFKWSLRSVIVMNSYCSVEHLLCESVLSPGLFRSNRVCNPLSHHKPCIGADAHTQKAQAHKCTFIHTDTHTPGTRLQLGVPCRVWLRGFVLLLDRFCQVPPHCVQQQAHTRTHVQRLNQHTHIWLCSIWQLNTLVMNEWMRCQRDAGVGGKTGQLDVEASRLITARLQLKAHHF